MINWYRVPVVGGGVFILFSDLWLFLRGTPDINIYTDPYKKPNYFIPLEMFC